MSVTRLQLGEACHGFVLDRIVPLPTLNLTLHYLTHTATGARMLHVACDDDNNLFGIGFRTPPQDSTGVAHILEHTTLCGSRRFPVRDPFFAMLKRSLSTFMNAMTASDWTLYPFSTQNPKDYYNLLDIYLDAVFFPLLTERDFSQEGHRLEFADPEAADAPLEYKGVVYNEMKGAMADPASLLHRRMARHLYPSTTYRHNSGGEPEDIPQLTWEQLRAFHAAYYHPSNSYLFSYGNLPLAEQLAFIQEHALRHFQQREVDSAVPPEERFTAPQRVTEPYPLDPGQPTARKTFVQLAWLLCDINDSEQRLALSLLSNLLLGNPGAPLYRALLESGLGANLSPACGYDDDHRTTYFGVGLQGTDPTQAEAVERLVLDTLEQVARDGFSADRIEGTIQRLEFSHKEVTGDSYPYPLVLLMRLLGTWIHGGDPKDALDFDVQLEHIRQACADGPFFQQLIRRQLLDNPHRLTLVLAPDTGMQQRLDEQIRQRLEAVRASLSEAERQAIRTKAQELLAAQEGEEDFSVLPTLELTDIVPEERRVHGTATPAGRLELHWFDQPTNGIAYVNVHLPTDDLPAELLPVVPIFCTLLTQVGAAGYDYAQMAERMEAHSGGIRFKSTVLEAPDRLDGARGFVSVRAKCLTRTSDAMFEILDDLFHAPNFKDPDRIRTVLQQIRVSFENGIPSAGHSYAGRAAAGLLSPGGRLRELWNGLEQLRRIQDWCQGRSESLDSLMEKLQALKQHLFCHDLARVSVTAQGRDFPGIRRGLIKFLNDLPEAAAGAAPADLSPLAYAPRQGFATSVPVSFVARTYRTVPYTHADAPALAVLAKLLRADYLHREIREKGGAYGGMAGFSPETGMLSLLSYRDPHIVRTLQVYDDAVTWAQRGAFTDEAVKEAILSVFSDLDRPLSPGSKGSQEHLYRLQGLTLEMRNRFRRGVLATDRERLVQVTRTHLGPAGDEAAEAVIANEEALRKAGAQQPGTPLPILSL